MANLENFQGRIGAFEVENLMARSLTGELYRGRAPETGDAVILKVLLPDIGSQSDIVARLRKVKNVFSALPEGFYLPVIMASPSDAELPYLVQPMEEGYLLTDMAANKMVPPVEVAISYLRHACEGLNLAARQGLVHGGITPGTMMITSENRLLMLEFGFNLYLLSRERLTQINQANPYASPQLKGGGKPDFRSDIYALGKSFAFFLSGGRDIDDPMKLKGDNPDIPTRLLTLLRSMTAEQEMDRPDYSTIFEELDRVHEEPEVADLPEFGSTPDIHDDPSMQTVAEFGGPTPPGLMGDQSATDESLHSKSERDIRPGGVSIGVKAREDESDAKAGDLLHAFADPESLSKPLAEATNPGTYARDEYTTEDQLIYQQSLKGREEEREPRRATSGRVQPTLDNDPMASPMSSPADEHEDLMDDYQQLTGGLSQPLGTSGLTGGAGGKPVPPIEDLPRQGGAASWLWMLMALVFVGGGILVAVTFKDGGNFDDVFDTVLGFFGGGKTEEELTLEQREKTRSNIEYLMLVIEEYDGEHGEWPTIDQMINGDKITTADAQDGWGQRMTVDPIDKTISSVGKDGSRGTSDDFVYNAVSGGYDQEPPPLDIEIQEGI